MVRLSVKELSTLIKVSRIVIGFIHFPINQTNLILAKSFRAAPDHIQEVLLRQNHRILFAHDPLMQTFLNRQEYLISQLLDDLDNL
jgi:hypothetical protein